MRKTTREEKIVRPGVYMNDDDDTQGYLAAQPVAPDPAPIIRQLITALEGSGTKMRSDQWYIEIEAVAAGKHYLNSKGENQ